MSNEATEDKHPPTQQVGTSALLDANSKSKYGLAADLINCIPTNWCDPLLTGDTKVLPDGYKYTPQDIENLLIAIRKRMEKMAGI